MSAHPWRLTTPERMYELVHEFTLTHGRCVAFVQGHMLVLRSATDARNSKDMDDEVGQFDVRSGERYVLARLMGGMVSELSGGR
jgi:hypothetical protein